MARSEKKARKDTARESDALADATAHLAGLVAGVERSEERLAGRLANTGYGVTPKNGKAQRQRALLIINTKSGPNNDSIGRVRDVIDLPGPFHQTEGGVQWRSSADGARS